MTALRLELGGLGQQAVSGRFMQEEAKQQGRGDGGASYDKKVGNGCVDGLFRLLGQVELC